MKDKETQDIEKMMKLAEVEPPGNIESFLKMFAVGAIFALALIAIPILALLVFV